MFTFIQQWCEKYNVKMSYAAQVDLAAQIEQKQIEEMNTLASAMNKFAPDLMGEFESRFKAAEVALEEFIEAMRANNGQQ